MRSKQRRANYVKFEKESQLDNFLLLVYLPVFVPVHNFNTVFVPIIFAFLLLVL
jgi:hypothetical protein